MKRWSQILVAMAVAWSSVAASAAMQSAELIGEWCLVHQSMLGDDGESLPPKAISDNLRARPNQSYHFKDEATVEVTMEDQSHQNLVYSISGSKKNRIRIRGWQSFRVKSLRESEIRASVFGTVEHRFTRGPCRWLAPLKRRNESKSIHE